MNNIQSNQCFLAILFFVLLQHVQDNYGDNMQSINVYADLGNTIILPCKLAVNSTKQRWLKEHAILATGLNISEKFPSHERFNIDVIHKENMYNIIITNVTESDFGHFKCLIQNDRGVFQSNIILKRQDEQREATTVDGYITEQSSTATMGTNQREEKEIDTKHTTGFVRDYLYYMLLAVGLIVVLSLSVGSSFCINHNCKGKMSPQHENIKMHNNATNQQLPEHEIDEEVIYEMCSSEYESIDERQIITNTWSGSGSGNLNSEASTHSKMEVQNLSLPVSSYLEVIDDIHYHQQENRVNGGIPSLDSTLTSLSETQRQDYETIFPIERTKEAEILQLTRGTSNDLEYLAESFRILFASKHSSFSSNSAYSSAENDATSSQQDDYLNPYMPLNTNEMDYLESYSAPINRENSETILSKD